MQTPDATDSLKMSWGKSLIGVGLLILSASFGLSGGPWWQVVSAGVIAVLAVLLIFSGARGVLAYRRALRAKATNPEIR